MKIQDMATLQAARRKLQADSTQSEIVLHEKVNYLKDNTLSVIWNQFSPFNDGQTKGIEGVLKFINKNVISTVLGLNDNHHHGDVKHRHSNQLIVKLVDYFLVKYSLKGAGRLVGALLGAGKNKT